MEVLAPSLKTSSVGEKAEANIPILEDISTKKENEPIAVPEVGSIEKEMEPALVPVLEAVITELVTEPLALAAEDMVTDQ